MKAQISNDGPTSQDCCNFFNSKYGFEKSLVVPSSSAAFDMVGELLDLKEGDEVIVPAFTTTTVVNNKRGVKFVFADSDQFDPAMSVTDILKKVTDKTKAIVVVHFAGIPVNVARILKETNNSIPVIEDCAQAMGAVTAKTKESLGKAGALSVFSFDDTEGGLLVVNDEKLWTKAQSLCEEASSEIDAALIFTALQNYDKIQERKLALWKAYVKTLIPNSCYTKPPQWVRSNATMYYIALTQKEMGEKFVKTMFEQGVELLQVKSLYQPVNCEKARKYSRALFQLPLSYSLTDERQKEIVSILNKFAIENGMIMVPATEDHWESIRVIRNKHSESFQNSDEIPKEAHWNFMRKHHKTYFVSLLKGECTGFIGLANNDFRLAAAQKGNGAATFMGLCWIHDIGCDHDFKCLRANKSVIGYGMKFGFLPSKESWENGDDPVKLVRICDEETFNPLEAGKKNLVEWKDGKKDE